MDNITKQAVDNFVDHLSTELHAHKHLNQVQLEKWSFHPQFKIVLHVFYQNRSDEVTFDVREVKENIDHMGHVTENVVSQIAEKFDIHV